MRRSTTGALLMLAAYSGLLLAVEATQGPTFARLFLDDPLTTPLFAHVNTALSSALLLGCALLFAAGRRVDRAAGRDAGAWFARSQVVFFLFLAADERFRLLAKLSDATHSPEEIPYALLAAIELALLLGPGGLAWQRRRAIPVAAAGALYAASMALDVIGHHWTMGYAIEELPKVWAGALMLRFAWRRFEDSLEALAEAAPGAAFAWARTAAGRRVEDRVAGGEAMRRAKDRATGAAMRGAGEPAGPDPEPAGRGTAAPPGSSAAAPKARGAHSKSGRP